MSDVADFLFAEAELLDRADYEPWLKLFTADARYWVPLRPGQSDPINEVSLFYEDRTLMRARVGRLSHPRALGLTTRTSRLIGNVRKAGHAEDGSLMVASRFQMVEFVGDEQRLHAGAMTHHLVDGDDGWRIRLKRVDLVNAGGIFDLLQVFF